MSGTPPQKLPARTAASDGQRIFTRAARSAGLRFAVCPLYETYPIATNHLFHRKRSPFPYEGKKLKLLRVGNVPSKLR